MPVGVVYRPQLRVELFHAPARVDYLVIVAEHYLDLRGRVRDDLDALKASFPIVVHALGLCIGSAHGIDERYLERLARLVAYVRAPWWSDHLAAGRAASGGLGHFVPLRRDAATLATVARNAALVRRTIATPFALENPALPYVVPGGTLDEATFLVEAAAAAQCRLLLDVENLQANERNWNEPAEPVIDRIPSAQIAELHVAGGRQRGYFYVDSHDAPVSDRTWALCGRALAHAALPVTLERDANLPNMGVLDAEIARARSLAHRTPHLTACIAG